jgi:hypothetical protein
VTDAAAGEMSDDREVAGNTIADCVGIALARALAGARVASVQQPDGAWWNSPGLQ